MNQSTRRRTLLKGMGAASLLATGAIRPAFPAVAALAPPVPPGQPNAGLSDQRGWALNASRRVPDNARVAFAKHKLKTAATQPTFSKERRERVVALLAQRLHVSLPTPLNVPGGVGYGVFYTDAFKQAWGAGTAITHDLICPLVVGGNSTTYVYLTSTNRAAYGVEAFVSYTAQDQGVFVVFDWARPNDPWQLAVPFAALGAYLFPRAQSGVAPQVLTIQNATFQLAGAVWRNEAYLYNYLRHGWDLVYQYDYFADAASQKNPDAAWWGPIVETFQDFYTGTNPVGVRGTRLAGSDNFGNWSAWSLLRPQQSYVREDNVGFELRNIAPNFAYVALS